MNKEEFLKLFVQCIKDGDIEMREDDYNNSIYIFIYDEINKKVLLDQEIKRCKI